MYVSCERCTTMMPFAWLVSSNYGTKTWILYHHMVIGWRRVTWPAEYSVCNTLHVDRVLDADKVWSICRRNKKELLPEKAIIKIQSTIILYIFFLYQIFHLILYWYLIKNSFKNFLKVQIQLLDYNFLSQY